MTSDVLHCASCQQLRLAGQLLMVIDRQGQRSAATVCRHEVSAPCLRWAGLRSETAIALFDVQAARAFDLTRGPS